MLQPTRRATERPPNKIAGIVYILIGAMAIAVSGFVLGYQQTVVGPTSDTWVGFGIVIALYGAFRILTGVTIVRRAAKLSRSATLPDQSSQTNPPLS